jgi:hypothetical protein
MNHMNKLVVLSLLPAFAIADLAAQTQTSEFLETGMFDTGRIQANLALDFHRQQFWNGLTDNPANVGWNLNGMWWSVTRFGSDPSDNPNPELFNKLDAADEIYLNVGVLWLEVASALAGIVDPGVSVSFFLIPGLDIPEGSLPGWSNAWPYSYPTQIKVAEINPAEVPHLRSGFAEWGLLPATEQERRDNLQPYDITTGIKDAIDQGLLTETTPWGIVFFTEEALPLTPNDPKYADLRQTVLDAKYISLELVTGVIVEPTTWAGYDINEDGDVDTVDWMGFLNVTNAPWVYSYTLGKYIYLPEANVSDNGAWAYVNQ